MNTLVKVDLGGSSSSGKLQASNYAFHNGRGTLFRILKHLLGELRLILSLGKRLIT